MMHDATRFPLPLFSGAVQQQQQQQCSLALNGDDKLIIRFVLFSYRIVTQSIRCMAAAIHLSSADCWLSQGPGEG